MTINAETMLLESKPSMYGINRSGNLVTQWTTASSRLHLQLKHTIAIFSPVLVQ